ncbi:thiopeptide-type bacteriocin biosynthesis protein [Phytomonospora endophytica]|uniref:Thiopeptide-type bacteriocin biosynthesis protein n=1 Tax=Phytomonospora endophytica TaxID=714109 RepID=A0A841FK17_9ACTN|nr:thiopeptide-type bacteriocin biosynthesis protein [Phytomonospora endophytica]MBB6037671.1 thiopeptide-type bacteriocin biosynthesis protein [Phytomonospora endophytica]GIG67803.1 hypothetical protein Pen01_40980 [Phytomonospora endophytica]
MPNTDSWRQINVAFTDPATAETTAVIHLAPILAAADTNGAVSPWFFIRKTPSWRIRCQPADPNIWCDIRGQFRALVHAGHIADMTEVVYEPESHAFGGPDGMAVAHALFHTDSQQILHHLASAVHAERDRRRELALLLPTFMLRAAGQDWYEQGDVWARVAEHRTPPASVPLQLPSTVHRLISVDASSLTRTGQPLAHIHAWAKAYTDAGRQLAMLNETGQLQRGLRRILAHHIVFAWNRLGLSASAQSILASTAATVIFGEPRLSLPLANGATA